jgi:hypothetical protein
MQIEDYEFGRIVIDGQVYTDDIIIIGDTIYSNWWRKKGHELQSEDISRIIEAEPGVLVVGNGYYGRMTVRESAGEAVERIGCELIVKKTGDATQTYNELDDKDGVAAAFHLSC